MITMRSRLVLACLAMLMASSGQNLMASPKKGIALSAHDNPNWAKEVTEANVSWVYTWAEEQPADLPNGVEFVPMLWGRSAAEHVHLPENAKELLAFNEPDMPDQSNMPVDEAIEDWPILAKTGLTIGSPAPSWWSTKWMQQFMTEATQQNLKIDFVCIHWYNVPDPKLFLSTIDQIYSTYHKPIWITEFAIGLFDQYAPTYSRQQVEDFMRAVIPELNKRDYVQRYAWFPASPTSARMSSSALFNEDGSLTDLGKLYASL